MKKLISFFSAVLIFGLMWGTPLMAQPNMSGGVLLRQEGQKKAKSTKVNAAQSKYINLLQSKRFVFEGRRAFLSSGPNELVSAQFNYMVVKDKHVRVHFDFPGLNGPEGLGIISNGKLENWHFDAGNAHRSITVSGQIPRHGNQSKINFSLTVGNDGSGYLHLVSKNSSFNMTGVVVSLKKGESVISNSDY